MFSPLLTLAFGRTCKVRGSGRSTLGWKLAMRIFEVVLDFS